MKKEKSKGGNTQKPSKAIKAKATKIGKVKAETIDETLDKIKDSGLLISLIDPSSDEAKEHCAYLSCNDAVIFSMEGTSVCQKHAVSLMNCFNHKI